jgi:hypothetical protein
MTRDVPRGEGVVRTIPTWERCEFPTQGMPPQKDSGRRIGFGRGEFVGCSFTRGQFKYGGTIAGFMSQRSYRRLTLPCGTHSPPRIRVGVPPRSDRMDFANPAFEKMVRHLFDSFYTNPSAESCAHSRSCFLFFKW